MKTDVKNDGDCQRRINVELPSEEVVGKLDKIYRDINRQANIPGFRPGRAPEDIIRQKYQDKAKAELINTVVPEACAEAIESADIQMIGEPAISEVKIDDANKITFTVKVSVKPQIKLKRYKGVKITRKKVQVTNEDVTKHLETLQEQYPEFADVADRPAKEGDFIQGDLNLTLEGKKIESKKDIWFVQKQKISGVDLYEALLGMRAGEDKEIELTLPDDYPQKNLCGKKAHAFVKVKSLKEKKPRKIDDEFAKAFTGLENLDEMRKVILKDLEHNAQRESLEDVENQILDTIIKESKFPVPGSLVESHLHHMMHQTQKDLELKGLKPDEINNHKEVLHKKMHPQAEKQIRVFFILDEIARLEHISVTSEDLEEAFGRIAGEAGQSPEAVRAHYQDRGQKSQLLSRLRQEKIIQFLIDQASE